MGKNDDTAATTKKPKKSKRERTQIIESPEIQKTIKKKHKKKKSVKHPEECESISCGVCNMAFYRRKETLLKKAEVLNRKFPDVEVLVVVTSRRNKNKLFSFSSDKFEPITTTNWGLRLFEDHLNPEKNKNTH